MANTDQHKFRCDTVTRWDPAMEKAAQMREAGYDVDLTLVLNHRIDEFLDETMEATAERMGLERETAGPAPIWRRPSPRPVAP